MPELQCKCCKKFKPFKLFTKVRSAGPLEEWNLRSKCKACLHQEYLDRRTKPKRRKAMMQAARNWKKQNPERHAEINQAYRLRHPEKVIAQNRLGYAVRSGNVVRGPCEACGTTERVQAHHRSYKPEDWYNVRWLCVVCHNIEHSNLKRSRPHGLDL